RRQLWDSLDAKLAIRPRDDVGRVGRAAQRARSEEVHLWHELAEAEGAILHLAAAIGREPTGGVVAVGTRGGLAAFGDAVPDDEQVHGQSVPALLRVVLDGLAFDDEHDGKREDGGEREQRRFRHGQVTSSESKDNLSLE